jgi:predicted Rossmann-fold nucleotide-binding protein
VLNAGGFFDGLLAFVDHSIDEGFVRREYAQMLIVSSSPDALLDRFDQYVAPVVPKWIDVQST